MDEPQPEPTRLPIEIETEDPFIQWEMFNIGIRQALTLALGLGVWYALMKVTMAVLPLSPLFAGLVWSWLLFGAVFLAFVTRDGVSMEEYLTRKIAFLVSERHFILKEREEDRRAAEAEWSSVDDEDDEFDLPRF